MPPKPIVPSVLESHFSRNFTMNIELESCKKFIEGYFTLPPFYLSSANNLLRQPDRLVPRLCRKRSQDHRGLWPSHGAFHSHGSGVPIKRLLVLEAGFAWSTLPDCLGYVSWSLSRYASGIISVDRCVYWVSGFSSELKLMQRAPLMEWFTTGAIESRMRRMRRMRRRRRRRRKR
jgi:hypothetical protein